MPRRGKGDQDHRAQHRQHRRPAGIEVTRIQQVHRRDHQHQPHQRHQRHLRRDQPVIGHEEDQPPRRQLPYPERRREEPLLPVIDQVARKQRQPQRHHEQHPQQPREHRPVAPGQQDQHRQHDVELLLDRQRPRVQERVLMRRGREIADRIQQVEVVREGDRAKEPVRHQPHLRTQEVRVRQKRGDKETQRIGRRQPPYPPGKELGDRIGPLLQPHVGLPADQVARQHEEDVDPDEPAQHVRITDVEQHHAQHGNGAHAVKFPAVGQIAHAAALTRPCGRKAAPAPSLSPARRQASASATSAPNWS